MVFRCKIFFILFGSFFLNSCKKNEFNQKNKIEEDKNQYTLINTYAHDMNSFTEGLFIDNEVIYESTGSPENLPSTKSVFGVLDLKSGAINIKSELDRNIFFGEGITKCGNKIYQLTYKNKTGFIYDAKNYKKIGSFQFENIEGWGLTNIGNESLIMSDGTNVLTFMDPKNLKVIKRLEIFENKLPISNLNELEYVKGFVYANIYTTNKIVKIDAKTGNIVQTLDLTTLYQEAKNRFSGSLEMNGIAYNDKKNTFFITGKLWPCIFEIQFIK
ncbi:glutaminyl-peptide cyclotransferase [Flavobacterium collinsii]|uniref:glutaminyl-peptide cyclotransferase n=1 Tax=Flavobacterium collinsii TaxID=1114861 RepID=UPI0022C851F0|nr:glutaminyl-peptide cyclotransferase [Flavobacterium collinsii]GIQ61349.1 glutaminyl-peptide cyclotransferase [Flavobacterium collinsii]